MLKQTKTLFFINSSMPTEEEIEAAGKIAGHVVFRNARMVPAEGCLEECDSVAGAIPTRYAEKYGKQKPQKAEQVKTAAAPKPAATAPAWQPNA